MKAKLTINDRTVYYIADTHFGHEKIIDYSGRPFDSVPAMDEAMRERWNENIREDDIVVIIGDLAYKSDDPFAVLASLKGKKYLVPGNHDKEIVSAAGKAGKTVTVTNELLTVLDHGVEILCCHYPLVEWRGQYRNALHFYGHVHNNTGITSYSYLSMQKNTYNVGSDILGFIPRNKDDVIRLNYEQGWKQGSAPEIPYVVVRSETSKQIREREKNNIKKLF